MGRVSQLKSIGEQPTQKTTTTKARQAFKRPATASTLSPASMDDPTSKPAVANKVKRRNRQGVVARRMAIDLRKGPGALLRRKPFANAVKHFLPSDCATENTHFISNTVELIRCGLEAKMVSVLERARLLAMQNGRILVRPGDVRLAYMMCSNRDVSAATFPGALVVKRR